MKTTLYLLTTTVAILAGWSVRVAAQHPAMPTGMNCEEHLTQMRKEADMKQRGAAAMGFNQDAVVHHFVLTRQGGTIQVEVANASDDVSRQAIRTHLQHIATTFAAGDFAAPLLTHGETPAGVATLQRLKSAVIYTFSETTNGGKVQIATANDDALGAIHGFLRYQIREHRTGDPLTVAK